MAPERRLRGRIAQAPPLDDREVGQRVPLALGARAEMEHFHAPHHQRVREQPPVAAPPLGLGAHDRRAPLGRGGQQPLEAGGELGRGHVVGVAPKLAYPPAAVG